MVEAGFGPAVSAGTDPIALVFRHVLAERRRVLFPPGARVLEIRSEAPQADGAFDAALSAPGALDGVQVPRSEEHTSELQSHSDLVCRLLLEKKKTSRAAASSGLARGQSTTHCS